MNPWLQMGGMMPQEPTGIVPDAAYNRLMKRMEEKSLQGINDQRMSVDKLNQYKEALLQTQTPQMDLTPLMQLADQWTGSNMAKSYQTPQTAGEIANRAMGVEQQIANQNSKITDDEVNLLKAQLQNRAAMLKGQQTPKLSAEQWKAGGFAARMADADAVIKSLENVGTDRWSQVQMSGMYPAELMGEEVKKIDQAQRNFINATLRRESGAAISPEEFKNARMQYFPQPGDTAEVLAQKAQNRQRVVQSFSLEGGGAYDQIVGQNPIYRPPAGAPPAPQTGGKKPSYEEWKASKGYK